MGIYYNPLNKKLSTEQRQANAIFIRDYLLAKGWKINPICGVIGNFDAESAMNPNVFEGWYTHSSDLGKYGYGLAQWTPWLGTTTYNTPEEQRNYHGSNNPTFGRWCIDNGRDKSTLEAQLDYINKGLGGYKATSDFPESFSAFKASTKSVSYCAKLFYVNYERSKKGTWGDRPSRAESWLDFLSGSVPEIPIVPDVPDNPAEPPSPIIPTPRKGMSKLLLFAVGSDLT